MEGSAALLFTFNLFYFAAQKLNHMTDEKTKDYITIPKELNCTCLACGKALYAGRNDKKFCNKDCKNTYHNNLRMNYASIRRATSQQIKNNYKILTDFLKKDIESLKIDKAMELGFQPKTMTRSELRPNGWVYYCYDIAYRFDEKFLFDIARVGPEAILQDH